MNFDMFNTKTNLPLEKSVHLSLSLSIYLSFIYLKSDEMQTNRAKSPICWLNAKIAAADRIWNPEFQAALPQRWHKAESWSHWPLASQGVH